MADDNNDPVLGVLNPSQFIPPATEPKELIPTPVANTDAEQVEKDFNYARENMIELIQNGTQALDELMNIARQTENARAYEVIATLIKTNADTIREFMQLQMTKIQVKPIEEAPKNQTINNNLFVTTKEIQAAMKRVADQRTLDETTDE